MRQLSPDDFDYTPPAEDEDDEQDEDDEESREGNASMTGEITQGELLAAIRVHQSENPSNLKQKLEADPEFRAATAAAADRSSATTTKESTMPRGSSEEEQSGPEGIKHAFNLLVAAKMQRHPRISRMKAVAMVQRDDPGMHSLYLQACNPKTAFPRVL